MELNIDIGSSQPIIDGDVFIHLTVQCEDLWEVWPIGYAFSSDEKHVVIRASQEDGQVEFAVLDEQGNDAKVLEPILPIFFLVNGAMQIRSDQKIEVDVVAKSSSGDIIEDIVKVRSQNFMSSMSEPRIESFPSGRMLLRINVEQPSQICLDLCAKGETYPHSSICIAHEEGENGCWANVYRDIMDKGIWIPGKRVKMGYFHFNKQEPYEMVILVRDNKVYTTFSSINGAVTMREGGDIEGNVDSIRIRESPNASGQPGIYDIEVV